MSEGDTSVLESDASSVISISDALGPSDTEEEGYGLHDKNKFCFPDIGKTRLHLRTKEPLSPSPRPVPRSPGQQASGSVPSTPRRMPSGTNTPYGYYSGFNASTDSVNEGEYVSFGLGLGRANSIYTLGRASLQGQLSHLTSLRLPDANSLAKKVSDIPTSAEAAKALSDASEQIRIWITKASDVLNGLNAEDDVEWAAAGGRDGVDDIDGAINKFQQLVDVYLLSIEELQTRDDASSLPPEDLKGSVRQMEEILSSWQKVRETLKGVKEQVEIAMEWETLWNTVLGEIAQEMEGLNRLVFEMEERRHQGAENLLSTKDSIDLNELETIVEDKPGQGTPMTSNRFSFPPFSPAPTEALPAQDTKDESSLVALFARMQPLRASLDFMPMRLAGFQIRGKEIFPSACLDLDQRRGQLEEQWKKLQADADSLRRELGEDRWILVFRNAGRQALKMEESITRSFNKLKEAVEAAEHQTSPPAFAKKVESYEAKKMHYGPAIERVLAIIDRGVQDRLTVNGEILRIQSDMKERWTALQAEMRDMDTNLEESNREKQLRDSVSTVMSSERSIASSLVDTPGSSPASSVVGTSRKSSFQGSRTPTPLNNPKSRKRSSSRLGPSSIPRRIPLTQSGEFTTTPAGSPLATRSGNGQARSELPVPGANRPRWSHSTKLDNRDFKPLSTYEPSPYAKAAVAKHTNYLRSTSTPTQTPGRLSRKTSTGVLNTPSRAAQIPLPAAPPTVPKISISKNTPRKSSLPIPSATPARATSALANRKSVATFRTPPQPPTGAARKGNGNPLPPPVDGNEADSESPSHHKPRSRPSSALSLGTRRLSTLPVRSCGLSKDAAPGAQEEKPKWRT